MTDDILADCAGRLLKAGVAPDVVIKTIAALRKDWACDAPYIAKIDRRQRDQAIAEALTAGLPLPEIAAKAQCSVRTIRRRRSEFTI